MAETDPKTMQDITLVVSGRVTWAPTLRGRSWPWRGVWPAASAGAPAGLALPRPRLGPSWPEPPEYQTRPGGGLTKGLAHLPSVPACVLASPSSQERGLGLNWYRRTFSGFS